MMIYLAFHEWDLIYWHIALLNVFSKTAHTYELQCPVAMQRNILNQRVCNKTHQYSCIYDQNEEIYQSTCKKPIQERPGFVATLLGGPYTRRCYNDRYQPIPFRTNQTSTCLFTKSVCSEKGSVLADRGTTRTDAKCRCDYTKGYSYINTPRDKCGCVPSEEDCSCYLMQCPSRKILSQDYTCIDQFHGTASSFACPEICLKCFSGLLPSTEKRNVLNNDITTTLIHHAKLLVPVILSLLILTLILMSIYILNEMGLLAIPFKRREVVVERKDEKSSIEMGQMIIPCRERKVVVEHEDEDSFIDSNTWSEQKDKKRNKVDAHAAKTTPQLESCRLLLKHNAPINKRDKKGRTPLIHACNTLQVDIAILLLKEGADANISDKKRNTPLIIASKNGLVSVVHVLLSNKVDVNALNKDGATALSLACKNGNTEIVKMLLKHGANPDYQDKEGCTLLMHAIHCEKKEHSKENE